MNRRKIESEIDEALQRIHPTKAAYFRRFLSEASEEIWDLLRMERRAENQALTQEKEKIENIYFLLEGSVRAVDYSVKGSSYEHTRFEAGTILGSAECLLGSEQYIMTLMTATPCLLFAMPKHVFERWLWKDTDTIRSEIERMSVMFLNRSKKNRVMLMMSGMERLVFLLINKCENLDQSELYILPLNRQELADQSGCSIKTVNRSIKKMEESGFLTRDGHKVKITQNQYLAMKVYLEKISNLG